MPCGEAVVNVTVLPDCFTLVRLFHQTKTNWAHLLHGKTMHSDSCPFSRAGTLAQVHNP